MAATAAATETERELDRVWKAIDDATGRISDLERALERGRGLQLAPVPDYRLNEAGPPPEQPEPADEPERCSCEEAVALRVRVTELEKALAAQTFLIRGQSFTTCSMAALAVLRAIDAVPQKTIDDWCAGTVHVRHIPACIDVGIAEHARRHAAGEIEVKCGQ